MRRVAPASDESLEPKGVMGDVLCGEYSELPPVDSLDPLPRLLLSAELVTDPVTEPAVDSAQSDFGNGGGTSAWGGG